MKTKKKRDLCRGEPVVRNVLEATRAELAQSGYRALRVEDVAARAIVHKTTIYRRWPTKAELVRDSLLLLIEENIDADFPDSGSLRGDLLELARRAYGFISSVDGQSSMRMIMAEGAEPEFQELLASIRKTKESLPKEVFNRAVTRGEITKSPRNELLAYTLVGAIQHQCFSGNKRVGDEYLRSLVDLLLLGALPRSESASPVKKLVKPKKRV